ncbi:MAG: AlpA family phage regulatory protein [Acidobacteria bacterium]|nr:AlpA family phage regulatory protein [Acidobacteriota bacterium]
MPALLRLPAVLDLIGVSPSTLYQRIRDGEFPRPVAIGSRARAWRAQDVRAWIESRPTSGARAEANPPEAA